MPHSIIAGISETGRRRINQDAIAYWPVNGEAKGQEVALLAVADGVGSSSRGEVAAQLAVQSVRTEWTQFVKHGAITDPEEVREFLNRAYHRVQAAIYTFVSRHPDDESMATTLVVAVIVENQVIVANVGDSRAYVLRTDSNLAFEQISEDHSAVQQAVNRGMSHEEATTRIMRSAITRALSARRLPEVDFFPPSGGWVPLSENAVVLLCTDGLTNFVSDGEIHARVLRNPDVKTACADLLRKSLQNGSSDNVSIVALEVGRLPRPHVIGPNAAGGLSEETRNLSRSLRILAYAMLGLSLLALLGLMAVLAILGKDLLS